MAASMAWQCAPENKKIKNASEVYLFLQTEDAYCTVFHSNTEVREENACGRHLSGACSKCFLCLLKKKERKQAALLCHPKHLYTSNGQSSVTKVTLLCPDREDKIFLDFCLFPE